MFTFWPPGPLERLNETWPMWRGIVEGDKEVSHLLANSRSESADLEANLRQKMPQGILGCIILSPALSLFPFVFHGEAKGLWSLGAWFRD